MSGIDPADATASLLIDEWTDDEVIALSDARLAGRIDESSPAFAKAKAGEMLDLGPRGWRVRDSAERAVSYVLRKRAGGLL